MNSSDASPSVHVLPQLRLPATVPRSGVSDTARIALRQLLGDVGRGLADAYRAGVSAEILVRARADAVDRVVVHVWSASVGDNAPVALYAVGGYGRSELFPHSDVDLLVLMDAKPAGATTRALESFFVCLWDLGLKPGHAVRAPAQSRELAQSDASVYTSLLDARRICGSAQFDGDLAALLADDALWPRASYLAARRQEQAQRHARFNDTAYNLEPNLKDGPGGLRSFQTAQWLGRRLFDAPTPIALAERGLLSAAEAALFDEARAVLWRIRYGLHLLAGRAEERLLFDYQRALATQFGFVDEHRQNLGVEQFMQSYYRAAIALERLNDQLMQRFDEELHTSKGERPLRLNLDFVSVGGRLDADPPDLLSKRPAALIDLFRVWIEHPEVVALSTALAQQIQLVLRARANGALDSPDVYVAFLRLLRKGAPAVEALARMNRCGVLAAIVPAFARVVGRMQYDLFHVYTVDEHTLRVLRIVARFAEEQTSREFALAHQIWSRVAKPELLLLAALFHDLAKGRGGDHSELGETQAREFCRQLGLHEPDEDLVAWLVRWHLLMSTTAQRQDIADPDVVHRFAALVADWEHLDYLYLLTVADITGTSPKLWNSWKDRLLADLYVSARFMLRAGLERPAHAAERARECQAQARALLARVDVDAGAIARIWADFPEASFLRYSPAQIAWQTAGIARTPALSLPLVLVEPNGARGGTEIFVYAADRDGLFATVTAVLDRNHLSVQEARIVNSRQGMSLDTFLVLDSQSMPLTEPERVAALRQSMLHALQQNPYRPQLARRTLARPLRHFQLAPQLSFDDDIASGRTQLALVCSDRPGLLAAVAQAFRERGVRVHDARIATFGERVEDFFQLTGADNRPLAEAEREALRAALLEHLQARQESTANQENHARA